MFPLTNQKTLILKLIYSVSSNSEPSSRATVDSDFRNPTATHFRGKSYFIPPTNRKFSIETFCRLHNKDDYQSHRVILSRAEKHALSSLASDSSIIIHSDRGGVVVALYTKVPHEEGIQTLEYFPKRCDSHASPSNHCIVTLAELVLTHNFFMFQDDFFLQHKGVATGSNMSCNFASLYVAHLEEIKQC